MAYKNGMNKTGIYQDRENGMLKNHGMLKDLGMMQEEGMRGMRRMRGLHQEQVVPVNITKAEEKESEQEMLSILKDAPSAVGVKEKEYKGEPLDIKFGGKSMRISGAESYTKPSGSEGFTVKSPGKGAFGIEVPKDSEQYTAIKKAISKYEYPFGKVTKK